MELSVSHERSSLTCSKASFRLEPSSALSYTPNAQSYIQFVAQKSCSCNLAISDMTTGTFCLPKFLLQGNLATRR